MNKNLFITLGLSLITLVVIVCNYVVLKEINNLDTDQTIIELLED